MPNYTFLHKRGTAAQWTLANPVLGQSQFGFETDTRRWKVGDGNTAWSGLSYAMSDSAYLKASSLAPTMASLGGIGDGTTNAAPAVISLNAQSREKFVEAGVYNAPSVSDADLDGPFCGRGQIKTSAGNNRAPYYSAAKAAPASFGTHDSVLTAFNGDISKCQFPVEHRITGAATLGQPTTGYIYTPEVYPHYTHMYVGTDTGWNQATDGNDGRTAACVNHVRLFHVGQGDAACWNASVYVGGSKPGATHWLASPAGVLFNGAVFGGADGALLNPFETHQHDNGFDVACVGIVNAFYRTNATGAKGAIWCGVRMQSMDTAACDSAYQATGKWIVGLDLAAVSLDLGATQAAISLKANQRIYLNNSDSASVGNLPGGWRTTVFNTDWMDYDAGSSSVRIVVGNNATVQVTNTGLTVAGNVFIPNGNFYCVNGIQVVGARAAGWTAMTGAADIVTTYAVASVTLPQLAGRVKAIQDALTTHGLIGA